MIARVHTGVLLAVSFWLGGCSGALNWTPDYHTVRAGETLYSIALRYNLDQRDLARWNRLGDGSYIREGQRLRLKPGGSGGTAAGAAQPSRPPARAEPQLPAPAWLWPTAGRVTARFGESGKTQSGIRLTGARGQAVIAAAAGSVVYAGDGLRSYGNLLIIKHNETWLTAYGFNEALLVREGDTVSAGQQIGRMGVDTNDQPLLHFEIRRNGQPVDPLRYLPAGGGR